MSDADQLREIRNQIDALDEQIQTLINARATCAKQVAKIKRGNQQADSFYRPEREADVLRRVMARNKGGVLGDETMARLFREIMSACLALEQRLQIAYLGPEGTFTQAAAIKHFGHAVETLAVGTIAEVFREVESGAAQFGVVPIENSTEGVVNHTLDTFVGSPLKICGEVELRIHQHLMATQTDLMQIKRLYSHQQSLGQCREWLSTHLPNVEIVAVSSNAEAARRAAQAPDAAAIAGEQAADVYDLKIVVSNIEDEPDNTTRFLVIGRYDTAPTGRDKTSILVSVRNKTGALHRVLEPFVRHGVSMSRIESRPSRRGMWDYVFFIDLEGHEQDPPLNQALIALEQEAAVLKRLGSYPRAVL
ncbi:MAG: prephenate dehydratase [Gammaproteobacteria bacterium]|nr:prephenate dehydratase [Gammaproteobacteria bacterium]